MGVTDVFFELNMFKGKLAAILKRRWYEILGLKHVSSTFQETVYSGRFKSKTKI